MTEAFHEHTGFSRREKTLYFDNAATTYPKPREVKQAVMRALDLAGGNPGRGSHSLSLASARTVFSCRETLTEFFNFDKPENVVFTMNATYALNAAIKSLIKPGSAVVTSVFEHNSVRRPLASLGCRVAFFDPRLPAAQTLAEIESALKRGTHAAVFTHSSNVLPVTAPAESIAALCRRYGAVCIVDASQSAGIIDLDLSALDADAVCFPGHKALYGPMGCGVCIFGRSHSGDQTMRTLIEGGSGVNSLEKGMPAFLPERFEAGTLCVPAIAGLEAGVKTISRVGIGEIRRREYAVARRAREILGNTPGVTLYDPPDSDGSVLLFNVDGALPEETAAALDRHGVCARAGLHCAPDAHRAAGTLPNGAVRLSFGMFNTPDEVETLYRIPALHGKR